MVQLINPLAAVNEGQQFVDGIFTQRANKQAGAALQQGNYNEAAGALFGNGDLRGGMGVQQYGQEQQAAEQARQLAFSGQAIKALQRVRSQGGNVVEAYASYAPVFQQMGIPADQVQQLGQALASNPDGFLTAAEQIVGQQARALSFQKTGDTLRVFEEGNPDPIRSFDAPREDYTLGQARFSGETNTPVAQAPRAAEFIQVDPEKDLVEIPGSAPTALGGIGGATRGQRNNNPGNIEDGPFAKSLPGYAGSDGRFAIFNSPQAGAQAGAELLNRYAARGVVTPAQVINRWAPPSDNNPTQAYAAYVANRLGIGVNDPIPENRRADAFQAINEFENGGQPPSSSANSSTTPRVLRAARPNANGSGVRNLTDEEKRQYGLPSGTLYQIDQDGKISQVAGSGDQKFTEFQLQSASYYNRVRNASQALSRAPARPSPAVLAFAQGQIRENALGQDDRRWIQAARDWLAPILRRDTGAAVTDGELATYMSTYLANPTDGPDVIAQKAQSRRVAEESLLASSNGAYGSLFNQQPQGADSRPRTNAPGLRFNVTEAQLQTRQRIVGQGGRPSQPLGSTQNPRYLNPSDPRSSYNNVRRGEYYVSPDGQMRQKR